MFGYIKKKARFAYIVIDLLIIFVSLFIAMLFFYSFKEISDLISNVSSGILIEAFVISIIYISIFVGFGIYKNSWLNATVKDIAMLLFLCLSSSFLTIFANAILNAYGFDIKAKVTFLTVLFISVAVVASRVFIRIVAVTATQSKLRKGDIHLKKLLIIGAGSATRMFLSDMLINKDLKYDVVGLIDDDPNKKNTIMAGKRVLGNRLDVINICAKEEVDEILIAMPSAGEMEIRKILEICSKTDCKVKIMPSISKTVDYEKEYRSKIRDVQIEDLLVREPVVLNNSEIVNDIEGKVILVSGGGGSIGSELCRQIASYNPKTLIVLDIYENNAYDLQNELYMQYPFLNVVVLIASVREIKKLDNIFKQYKPDVIFHAAAHKHVPLMEYCPDEAVKNNVFGTLNMAICADKYGVEKFVMISTDKAVNPSNVMGATKRISEMIIQTMNSRSETEFVAVRFGNVLGSSGSVIPLFKKQIQNGGPVTLTHREITRFFMTIPEAAQLVLQASYYANGGEIFVLDMGEPVKIYDLAYNLIKLSGYRPNIDIEIKITGLRPGEKLYEEILMAEEGLEKTAHSKIFVGKPTFCDYETLQKELELLKAASEEGDNQTVIEIISRIVPTYTGTRNKKRVVKEPLNFISENI